MNTVSHLIFTRFNLAIHFGCAKRRDTQCPDSPWLNEKYLADRFEIFERYTYPSFQNQTDQNFKWIVLFHKDTPQKFKQRIQIYEKETRNFEAWYFDDSESACFEDIIYQYIKENLSGGLITTRVDNDDFVHKKFVESIKNDFAYQNEAEILTYPNGLQYDSRSSVLLKYNHVNNHFLSLYISDVKNSEINHILQFNHGEIDKLLLRHNIKKLAVNKKPPLWVEVITDSNYSNGTAWRFQRLLLPMSYNKEYPSLKLWNDRKDYIHVMIMGIIKVFINRTNGLLLRIKKHA